MTMIFQDPTSSLNPAFTHRRRSSRSAAARRPADCPSRRGRRERSAALADVSIHEPERVLDSYAFQLSGGMNQRVMIAMALANGPALLIADEPGTALDVTRAGADVGIDGRSHARHRTAVLFISHNLGVVREFADRVYVIYRGRIVEQGDAARFRRAAPPLYAHADAAPCQDLRRRCA